MPNSSSPSLLRVGLRVFGVLLVLLILVVTIGARRGVLPNFEKRVAALKAAGEPVDQSDLPSSKPLSIEHQAQLARLVQAMDRLSNAVPAMAKFTAGDPVFLETASLRQEIIAGMMSESVVRHLRQPVPSVHGLDAEWNAANRGILIQEVSSHFRAAALDALKRDQVDEAVCYLTNAIRLRITPEPFAIASPWPLDAGPFNLVLVRLLDSHKLQRVHLEQLQQTYQALDATPLYRNQLIAERVSYIADTRWLAAVDLSGFSSDPSLQPGVLRDWLWLRIRLHLGFLDTAGCTVLDELAAQLADLDRIGDPALRREYAQRQARIRSMPPRISALCFMPHHDLDQEALSLKSHARLGLLAIAATRYRLDHAGGFPASPTDLVPRYLSLLPVDPFSGGPPVLSVDVEGLRIGFDRSRLTGSDAVPADTPGGPSARLHLGP